MNAFAAAVKALGGVYLPNETKVNWYGQFLSDWTTEQREGGRAAVNRFDAKRFGTTDAGVARFPNCSYDVGLLKNDDGSYTPYFDSYGTGGRGLTKVLGGMDCVKLKDEYAAAVSIRTLARKGFRVQRTAGPKGEIILKARSA